MGQSFLRFRLASFFGDAVNHHATYGSFSHALSVHKDFAGHTSDATFPDEDGDLNAELVARDHRTTKACAFNSGKDHQLFVAVLKFKKQERCPGLGHGLHEQHPGHEWLAGKMPHKERFVRGDVLEGHNLFPPLDFHDPVQQKKRIAMRQNGLDFLDVKRANDFAGWLGGFYGFIHG